MHHARPLLAMPLLMMKVFGQRLSLFIHYRDASSNGAKINNSSFYLAINYAREICYRNLLFIIIYNIAILHFKNCFKKRGKKNYILCNIRVASCGLYAKFRIDLLTSCLGSCIAKQSGIIEYIVLMLVRKLRKLTRMSITGPSLLWGSLTSR